MKNLATLFFILLTIPLLAQKDKAAVDAKVIEFAQKLEARGIATYFTTQRYCEGETQMFVMADGSRCFSKGTYAASYILWSENGRPMIKKIDNCGMFASSGIEANLYSFFEDNAADLQKNKVKPYEIENSAGGPISRTEINNCHRAFQFVAGGVKSMQAYNSFDLTNEAREPNINFEYNNALKVVALDAMLDKVITTYEANAAYRRM